MSELTYPVPALAERTIAELQDIITRKGDFPSISGAVKQIVSAMRDENSTDFDLAQSVLTDFALTQRVIRLANSAMYSAFGGPITTVSRAIYVLGTETVGHLALGLKFIDQLEKAAGTSEAAVAEFTKAVVAGSVARKVTEGMPSRDAEESVVCTLLHSLGRLLVTFYLPRQWGEICALTSDAQSPRSEQESAEQVLGLSLHSLGRAMANKWGLPAEISATMQPASPGGDNPLTHGEWLATLANFSTECSKALAGAQDLADDTLRELAHAYAGRLGVEAGALGAAASAAAAEEECQRLLLNTRTPEAGSTRTKPADAYAMLDHGLRDMAALASTADLPTLAGLMIEALHASLGCRRVFLFLRNGNTRKVAARLALGEGARDIMPRLSFDEAFEPDVFHISMAHDRPVFIEDATSVSMQAKLPRWYKQALPEAKSFLCVPLMASGAPVGLVYADWEAAVGPVVVEPHELAKILKMRDVLIGALGATRK
jgi:HD-like signal output (HDOD) protein